jgi:DNA-binding NtrC family response regulator
LCKGLVGRANARLLWNQVMARILVIDDDRAVRSAVQLVLENEGLEVHVADDGRSGLKILTAESFDLLIVDVFMPGMDGLETIRLVHEQKPDLPIIVMSGMSFRTGSAHAPDFLSMATKLGAICSLKKPFRPRELMAVVAECLEKSVSGPRIAPAHAAISSSDIPSRS